MSCGEIINCPLELQAKEKKKNVFVGDFRINMSGFLSAKIEVFFDDFFFERGGGWLKWTEAKHFASFPFTLL